MSKEETKVELRASVSEATDSFVRELAEDRSLGIGAALDFAVRVAKSRLTALARYAKSHPAEPKPKKAKKAPAKARKAAPAKAKAEPKPKAARKPRKAKAPAETTAPAPAAEASAAA